MKREEFHALICDLRREAYSEGSSGHMDPVGRKESRKECERLEAALLAEFDRLRDRERVAWLLRKERGVDPLCIESHGVGVSVDPCISWKRADYVLFSKRGPMANLGPECNLELAPDPARVRAIIDREMEADHLRDATKMVPGDSEVTP